MIFFIFDDWFMILFIHLFFDLVFYLDILFFIFYFIISTKKKKFFFKKRNQSFFD